MNFKFKVKKKSLLKCDRCTLFNTNEVLFIFFFHLMKTTYEEANIIES